MKKSYGFTLIELVVVIVILGILAVVAVSRLTRITDDAYIASVNGVAGALRSTVALAKAQYIVDGDDTSTSITIDGQAVMVAASTGIPTGAATGIGAAMQSLDGFTAAYGATSTFRPNGNAVAMCQASYDESTGVVTVDISGC